MSNQKTQQFNHSIGRKLTNNGILTSLSKIPFSTLYLASLLFHSLRFISSSSSPLNFSEKTISFGRKPKGREREREKVTQQVNVVLFLFFLQKRENLFF